MTVTRHFLRDTQTETGTGGSVFDLSETQGSPAADVQGSINNTAFGEVLRWQITLGADVATDSFPTSLLVSAVGGTVEYRWRVQRLSAAGALLNSSAYSATQTAAGTVTATLSSLSPLPSAGEMLALSLELRRTGGHGTVTIDVTTQSTSSWVDPDLASGPTNVPVGQLAEVELVQALTTQKTVALGQPAEAELLQAVVATKTASLGQLTEAEVLQTVSLAVVSTVPIVPTMAPMRAP